MKVKMDIDFEIPDENKYEVIKTIRKSLKKLVARDFHVNKIKFLETEYELFKKLDRMISENIKHYETVILKPKEITAICYTNKKVKIGKAKCRENDVYIYRLGEAIAICRAMNWKDMERKFIELLE